MIRFELRPQAEPSAELLAMELPAPLTRLLAGRGLTTKAEAEAFLTPAIGQLLDPMALSDMRQAVDTVEAAIAGGEKMVIYGDYDVDGICATSILLTYLKKRRAHVDFYIPLRHEEGYGLNPSAVRSLQGKCDLLITVDCGITSAAEVALAGKLGMRVIVTDHHQLGEAMPDCAAVVNPLLAGYGFPKLCGAGVAWKLVWALGGQEAAMPLVDLAALATVADLVPLLGENRVLVAEGLKRLQQNERPGLRALIEVAGLTGREITAGHLGFQLGPRLNAAGRLSDAALGVELLTARDAGKAQTIAQELDGHNSQRRALEATTLEEALALVPGDVDFQAQRCVVLCGRGWNHGVIGLVASRLVERYHWPTVILTEEEGTCTGSARSIPGIDIHAALWECRDLFDRFGGHSMAAGLSMEVEKLPELRRRLSAAIADQEGPETFIPTELYDAEVALEEMDEALVAQLDRLDPTGVGNPAPVLLARGVRPVTAQCVGKAQEHLKLSVQQEGCQREAIAFRQGDQVRDLPELLDLLFAPSLNTWMGQTQVQLEVRRLAPTAPARAFREACLSREGDFLRAILMQIMYNSNVTEMEKRPEVESLDTMQMDLALSEALHQGSQGVLMLVQTLPALKKWIVRLSALGARLEFALGQARDPRMFHTLLAAPCLPFSLPAAPRVIALLDGAFSGAVLDQLAAAYPGARILVSTDAAEARRQALEALTPTNEQLREMYRQMRGPGQGTVASLAATSGLSAAMTETGLRILDELSLAQWRGEGETWSLLPPVKRDLSESRLLCALRAGLAEK